MRRAATALTGFLPRVNGFVPRVHIFLFPGGFTEDESWEVDWLVVSFPCGGFTANESVELVLVNVSSPCAGVHRRWRRGNAKLLSSRGTRSRPISAISRCKSARISAAVRLSCTMAWRCSWRSRHSSGRRFFSQKIQAVTLGG